MRYLIVPAAALVLTACATNSNPTSNYGNDALPSAQSEAAQRADARLNYDNARIEYDDQGCVLYRGTDADGQLREVPLTDQSGDRICPGKDSGTTRTIDNGGLPSAQVKAFQRADARLHYDNARIEAADDGCLMYQGNSPDGSLRQVPLVTQSGEPICR